MLLNALTGAVGAVGGTSPNAWNKFIPAPWKKPKANEQWNELNWPREYPLAHNEMSPIYPHLLLDGRGTQPVLFTRVLNPIWTYPDGYSWMRALRDESLVGLHGALTPTWSETAWWSDYVLPMGHGPERHDTHSYETHSGRWLGFRQPVQRVAHGADGPAGRVHLRGQPGRGLGGGRVLDRGLLARRSGRLAGHPPVLRVALPPRREDPPRGVLPLDVRELRARACPRRPPPRAWSRWSTCASTAAVEISRDDYAQHEAEVEVPEEADVVGREDTITAPEFDPSPPAAHRPARHDRHGRRRRRAARLQLPLAQARAVLRDARGVGLAGHGRPALPSQPRAPVADRSCAGRVRPAADLPAADDDPLALGQREVPQRALAHPSAARLPEDASASASRPATSRAWRPRSATS